MKLPRLTPERWLFVFDATVLTSVGAMAFGGSASHVYHLARQHGQQGVGAISVTALAEILFAYSGLEVRRRIGRWKAVPVFWLILTAGFIVWANLESTSDRSFTGRLIAVTPALVFSGVATLAETRTWGGKYVHTDATIVAAVHHTSPVHTVPAPKLAVAAAVVRPTVSRPAGSVRSKRQATIRKAGADWLASQGTAEPLTRQDVAQRLKVTPQRAGQLISQWSMHPELLDSK